MYQFTEMISYPYYHPNNIAPYPMGPRAPIVTLFGLQVCIYWLGSVTPKAFVYPSKSLLAYSLSSKTAT